MNRGFFEFIDGGFAVEHAADMAEVPCAIDGGFKIDAAAEVCCGKAPAVNAVV